MNRQISILTLLITALASMAVAQIQDTPDTLVYSVETVARYDDNRDATRNGREDQLTMFLKPGLRFNLDDAVTRAFFFHQPSLLWPCPPRWA